MKPEFIFNSSVTAIRKDINELFRFLAAFSTDNPQEAKKIFETYQKRYSTSRGANPRKRKPKMRRALHVAF